MKNIIKHLLSVSVVEGLVEIKNMYFDGYSTKSYSQEGEDLVLSRFFEGKKKGFYVEVGAHHPFRFSNTNLFYKKGWSGICIDPLPGTAGAFRKWRPRDVAVEVGVSDKPGSMTYYMFNEPALNTFDHALAQERNGLRSYWIIEAREVPVVPLAQVIQKHMPEGAGAIDFLSVDVEGFDLAVLRSNDWVAFRPRVVVVECLKSDLQSLIDDPVNRFLSDLHYVPYAKTGNSVIYVSAGNE